MKSIAENNLLDSYESPPWSLLVLIGIGLSALNFTPVSGSGLAPVLAVASAIIATVNPCTWLFYVAASQVVADPPSFPLTLGQLGVVAWLCGLLFRKSRPSLDDMRPFVRYVAPCVLWFYFASFAMRQHASADLLTDVIIGLISFGYIIRAKVRPQILLLCLILGTSSAMLGYWGLRFGLPVQATVYDVVVAGGASLAERTGSGRGDSNTAGADLSVLIIGTIALATFRKFWAPDASRYLNVLAILTLVAGIPALLRTYTRSALVGVIVGAIFLLLTTICVHRSRKHTLRAIALAIGTMACIIAIFVIVMGESPLGYLAAMEERSQRDDEARGGGLLLSGRMDVWKPGFQAMMKYPIAGAPAGVTEALGQDDALVTAGTSDWDRMCAHNIFIDFGTHSGLPGLFLMVVVFFKAPILLVRRRGLGFASPFIIVLVPVFFMFFDYSSIGWKFYWALLAIIVQAAGCSGAQFSMQVDAARPVKPFDAAM